MEVKTLLTALAMGESPRWHEDRLWFSDWGAQEIIAVDLDGNSEVAVRTSFGLPFCIASGTARLEFFDEAGQVTRSFP